ncbi:hypothetical protein RJ640_021545 [Escallonia rubra]|uniref:U1-type domain-containing protein n=1 Tax=Escallonia rubra TaxID=112253 RepID=A0AA88QN07_9ASTE|nr:hypothetical protein RJ640_021545 [Escallonia rubra]
MGFQEKYGPKDQGKASNGTTPKPKSDTKQKPEVDINVGLSERPPWYCSLCDTSATSRQTLLLHAEGKKHKAKARGFHASKQQPKQTEEYNPDTKISTENSQKDGLSGNNDVEELKEHQPKLVKSNQFYEKVFSVNENIARLGRVSNRVLTRFASSTAVATQSSGGLLSWLTGERSRQSSPLDFPLED